MLLYFHGLGECKFVPSFILIGNIAIPLHFTTNITSEIVSTENAGVQMYCQYKLYGGPYLPYFFEQI